MTLILDLDLGVVKMYLCTKNEVSRHSLLSSLLADFLTRSTVSDVLVFCEVNAQWVSSCCQVRSAQYAAWASVSLPSLL